MPPHRHFIIQKPYGFLSQFVYNQRRRKNKKLLGELHDFPEGTMSIGRLDQDSEGLLLLTTDGKESERVRSKEVEKEYYVQVDGEINPETIKKMKAGVTITYNRKPYKTLPCKVQLLPEPPPFQARSKPVRGERHGPTSWISVTIREGKFRQVRKMTAAVGYPTLRLVRIRIGNIIMKAQQPGMVQEVERLEI